MPAGATLLGGAQPFPLMSRVASGGVFYGGISELSMTLRNLSADGLSVFLSCWLFGLRYPALEPAGSWAEPSLDVKIDTLLYLPQTICCALL